MTGRLRRAPGVAALLVGILCVLAILSAAPAHADGYRYWSFWEQGAGAGQDRWTYATQGPSVARPDDGATIGFRFAVSQDSSQAAKPRGTAGFADICADTPAKGGSKRVALVVDFGTAADAPDGSTPPPARTACARVGTDASASEALAAVAKPLRYNSAALLCAIDGYPKKGCGEQVSDGGDGGKKTPAPSGTATTSTAAADDDNGGGGGPSAGLIGGIAAVLALGAAAWWQTRRRRG
ncbi:SCO2322 family protein [Streptomyces varsoviensis]|uniref:SCO2322 family protein n=1 Tax=Streptomyces varsoviensis TaxID=67373 RepID=UPI003F4D6AAC